MNASDSPKPPNVLWICTDQQRWDTIAALGNRHINTPNIDRLVAEGTACTNAYCQSPICTPSRASFLTGCYPSTVHGCSNGNEHWAEAAPLVTKLLADAGYCCGLAGKLHLAGAAGRIEPRPRDDGYTAFHWSHDPRDKWPEGHAYRDWVAARGKHLGRTYAELGYHPAETASDHLLRRPGDRVHGVRLAPAVAYERQHLRPTRPVRSASGLPGAVRSCLAAASRLPSQRPDGAGETDRRGLPDRRPKIPAAFDAQHKIAAYYAMIELIDDNVGRMLAALERTGQADNTLVIFTSDHGEMLGDHGLLLKGCRFYEGLVHVPLILRWPGQIPAGATTDALVELTDLAPTLLDAAGGDVPRHMAGRSLLPLLRGTTTEHRDAVRCEYYEALSMAPGDRAGWSNSRATMIRDRRYKLAVYHGHPIGELFDLEHDPHEHDNLWDSARHAEVRFDLLRRCFDATAFAIDTGPEATRSH